MKLPFRPRLKSLSFLRLYLLGGLLVIGLLSTWITHRFVQQIETQNIKLARALAAFFANVPAQPSPVTIRLIQDLTHNLSFPAIGVDLDNQPQFWIKVDADGQVEVWNRDGKMWLTNSGQRLPYTARSIQAARTEIERMQNINEPIPFERQNDPDAEPVLDGYLYYGESYFITRLRWLPFVVTALTGLFLISAFFIFQRLKHTEQRAIWVGMAKETAHQLGTPLSSLWGWLELLKTEPLSADGDDAVEQIGQDLERLNKVAARFSKIGATPDRQFHSLADITAHVVDYYRHRLPRYGKTVDIHLSAPAELPPVEIDRDLIEWVIENLIKNSIDAFEQTTGTITISIHADVESVRFQIEDTGKGIPRADQRHIFDPGFSTKKRGWGLGLALARRIIEDDHHGGLGIISSETGQGTVIGLWLPLSR